jgi:cytochrome c biogenesis protein CcmG, thiol:disulfide interchange protein DsbE
VVVNKWASWCGPCREEFPFFQAQAIERGDEVAFLGLLSDDGPETGATFLQQLPLPYPSYLDPDREIADSFNAGREFPSTLFFDAEGEVTFVKIGPYSDEATLAADIDSYASQ